MKGRRLAIPMWWWMLLELLFRAVALLQMLVSLFW
jgi:hypothetical protein